MPLLQTEPQYLGVPIFFAGKTWLVPSLSVLQFQQYVGIISNPTPGVELPEDATPEQRSELIQAETTKRFAVLIPILGLAMRRNYPEVTDEMLFDQLDLHTFRDVLQAAQAASGLEAVKPGEAIAQPAK